MCVTIPVFLRPWDVKGREENQEFKVTLGYIELKASQKEERRVPRSQQSLWF